MEKIMHRFGWAVLLVAGILSLWWRSRPEMPFLSEDSFQYLDAASSAASGECVCTRIAHFDEQLAPGHFPVAFTHFPPGYPLLLATGSRLGVPLEKFGYILSVAGYLLTLWMFWIIAQGLGGSAWISLALGLL